MIPLVAIIRIRHDEHKPLSVWIPVVLFWILLLPFAILGLPILIVVCIAKGVDPFRAIPAGLGFIGALTGTHIEVENQRARVEITVI